ncbi:hypothetical protein Efla_001947 [Eimeria flavescens]
MGISGGPSRDMQAAAGAPVGAGSGHLVFPHGPLMIPPGLPLPLGGPFPGGPPPALLPGAFALHHAAVAGAAAGAAAAAEEARKARERALMNSVPNDGGSSSAAPPGVPAGGPPGVPPGAGRGVGAGRGPGGKRHNVERASYSWRRQAHDEGPPTPSGGGNGRPHKGRGDWRGRGGGPHPGGSPGAGRWRVAEADGAGGGLGYMKRQRVVDKGAPPHSTSDSELSLMSVASDEQQQQRVSPSVEFVHRQKPSTGGPPSTLGGGPAAGNAGELSAVLTPMSSLSGSSRNSSLSRSSSPGREPHLGRRGPPERGGLPGGGLRGQGAVSQSDPMPEWPPGLDGPLVTSSQNYNRARSPPPPPGFGGQTAAASFAHHQAGAPHHSLSKRSPPKRVGKFLFDLWVPTTFHPLGKDAIKAVLGVRGSTHKEMERVAGAHVQIYGKQLNRSTKKHEYDEFRDNQPLHLVVTSDRLRKPNPTPEEQLQMVHRLQNMLEGLVLENWPAVAARPPHSFFERQQCLGPSTGPLVEVDPLTGSCRVVGGTPGAPSSPTSALRTAAAAAAAEEQLHAPPVGLQQRSPPPMGEELAAGQARGLSGLAAHQAGPRPLAQPQLLQLPQEAPKQQQQTHAVPWQQQQQQQQAAAAPQAACGGNNSPAAGREVRYQGDPVLLLDLPAPCCLLMLTLQGLHALLAEEGPCSLSALPDRFAKRWDVPFRYSKAEYGLDASCPLSWSDSLLGFVKLFPEVVSVADQGAPPWGPGNTQEAQVPTVASVDPPQFRAVAARMRQLLTAG